ALVLGAVFSFLTLTLWRSRKKVFFDQICIHQRDDLLKSEGILNMGAILRKSSTLLVLLDPTYVGRLWCTFEMAAWMKSHENSPGRFIVRPIIMGPISVTIFLFVLLGYGTAALLPDQVTSLWWPLFFLTLLLTVLTVHVLRGYHRSCCHVAEKLRSFKAQEAKCHCCSVGHMLDGRRLTCDRSLVFSCIRHWFGSVSNFDASVQTALRCNLQKQLGKYGLPYWWVIGMLSPCLWAELDFIAMDVRSESWQSLRARMMGLLAWYFGSYPNLYVCVFMLSWVLRQKRACFVADLCVSFGGALLFMLPCAFTWYSWSACKPFHEAGCAVFLAAMVLLALLIWSPSCTERAKHSKGPADSIV
ncbi:unnamed protein product, partial [Effrenium voratum]